MKKNTILKSLHKKRWFFYIVFLFLFNTLRAYPINENLILPPGNKPLEVTIHLHINKIYNINTVDETYKIDGYLEYWWFDSRWKSSDTVSSTAEIIYENDRARELINTKLWIPAMEMINIQGASEKPNISIKISPNGKINYEERFFGIFGTNMNFKSFPFDSQSFNIQIESFSYDNKIVIFTKPILFPKVANDSIIDTWEIIRMNSRLEKSIYQEDNSETETYSRAVFEIKAKRMVGYYIWQVLFPLFIIILASFVIFWIKDFGTQIGIGFTLMLTVVAFNFYSASILPKLPYQTFIETVIIVGYVFIFLGIIAVILNYRIFGNKKKTETNKLLQMLRYIFPLGFFVTMLIMYFVFNINNFW